VGLFTEGLALTGCIAVGNAAEVDVGIGIWTNEVKETIAAVTGLVATGVCSSAGTMRVALYY